MTKKNEELKKRDAIMTCTQIINMPKYKVIGHETGILTWDGVKGSIGYSTTIERPPKDTTNILVIYLKK